MLEIGQCPFRIWDVTELDRRVEDDAQGAKCSGVDVERRGRFLKRAVEVVQRRQLASVAGMPGAAVRSIEMAVWYACCAARKLADVAGHAALQIEEVAERAPAVLRGGAGSGALLPELDASVDIGRVDGAERRDLCLWIGQVARRYSRHGRRPPGRDGVADWFESGLDADHHERSRAAAGSGTRRGPADRESGGPGTAARRSPECRVAFGTRSIGRREIRPRLGEGAVVVTQSVVIPPLVTRLSSASMTSSASRRPLRKPAVLPVW